MGRQISSNRRTRPKTRDEPASKQRQARHSSKKPIRDLRKPDVADKEGTRQPSRNILERGFSKTVQAANKQSSMPSSKMKRFGEPQTTIRRRSAEPMLATSSDRDDSDADDMSLFRKKSAYESAHTERAMHQERRVDRSRDIDGDTALDTSSDTDDWNGDVQRESQPALSDDDHEDSLDISDENGPLSALPAEKSSYEEASTTIQDVMTPTGRPERIDELKQAISERAQQLAQWRRNQPAAKSRSELVTELLEMICAAYDYLLSLAQRFAELFPPTELVEFIEANESPRPLVIRTNTLKVRRQRLAMALIARGMNVDPVGAWSPVGLTVYQSEVPVGATPEYLAGYYMIQSASSFLPVMALAPREHERILDMAAAPGGKATYIAQLLKGTGMLFANDVNRERCKALVANLQRLGVPNAIVMHLDGRTLSQSANGSSSEHGGFRHYFDRVLLDAPCTGTGVIAHDASIKHTRDEASIHRSVYLQKQLLLAAIDACNPRSATGGIVVYSTCSVLVDENEQVVDYVIRKLGSRVKVLPTGLPFGIRGFTRFREKRFHSSLAEARRYYPHVHNMDGFFVCKLRVLAETPLPRQLSATASTESETSRQAKRMKRSDWQTKAPVAAISSKQSRRTIEQESMANTSLTAAETETQLNASSSSSSSVSKDSVDHNTDEPVMIRIEPGPTRCVVRKSATRSS
ncbi:rRNA (cytosine-C5-)-methyltransferase nop2 [Cyanidiococcus yangmingshanensis]|uniref:rRNA (Cytosine-C5-)-methyltransferase nop2 n=1 Tax=Cyanidiococcus yangmingshanensis TaxID=2690220 RepID=A0A7J7IPZ8_9RHOD|nr:rRNA (cytosine-C5-)-methyltransferase nop2 [Cyanidiococcus yangmingshanensis]